jgi:predicted  nucleic acid-binding Zn-ribbon protein
MKEAQGLESELGSLARRKSDLEDAELEVMERLEEADAAVAAQEAVIDDTNTEGSLLSAEAKRVVAEATAAFEAATRDRAAVAGSIAPELLAYYDRVAARSSGAALLRRGTCEGCRMVLAGTDMQAVRLAAEDAVITCPECGCILVRTEESGL